MASHPYLLALVQIACRQPCGVAHANKHTVYPMPAWQCFVRRYNYHKLVIPISTQCIRIIPTVQSSCAMAMSVSTAAEFGSANRHTAHTEALRKSFPTMVTTAYVHLPTYNLPSARSAAVTPEAAPPNPLSPSLVP